MAFNQAIAQIFLEGESLTLKRRKIGCMFGAFVALQKILTSKAKRKKYLDCFHSWEKNELSVLKKTLWSLFMDGVQLSQG